LVYPQELQTATDNFDPAYKLGAGGFGTVYRGVLPSGKEIAVKRSGQGQKDYNQFRNEVSKWNRFTIVLSLESKFCLLDSHSHQL
jgi:hypothetical protein